VAVYLLSGGDKSTADASGTKATGTTTSSTTDTTTAPRPEAPRPNNPQPQGGNRQTGVPPYQDDGQRPPPPPALVPLGFSEQAVRDLRDKDFRKRGEAVRRLESVPNDAKQRAEFEGARADGIRRKEVAAALLEVVRTDGANRKTAANALKLWATPEMVPDLIKLMEGWQFGDRAVMMDLLGALKDVRAVPALIKVLRGFDTDGAAAALESIGAPGTAELAKALDDPKLNREAVCRVLGKVGTADAIPALRKLSADRNPFLARAAQAAEKQITERAKG